MSIRDWFRSAGSSHHSPGGDTETVRRIVAELESLEPPRARLLAAFAYVLSRVAGADLHISDLETTKMAELIGRLGNLPEAQALLVVEIAKTQNRLFGGTEDFLVTREFSKIASEVERCQLLDCLFVVSAADNQISSEEEAQIAQIARELGFSHDEIVKMRLAYAAKRSVVQRDAG
jgi:uncharacterized tellurite resistance protein B-like protein